MCKHNLLDIVWLEAQLLQLWEYGVHLVPDAGINESDVLAADDVYVAAQTVPNDEGDILQGRVVIL